MQIYPVTNISFGKLQTHKEKKKVLVDNFQDENYRYKVEKTKSKHNDNLYRLCIIPLNINNDLLYKAHQVFEVANPIFVDRMHTDLEERNKGLGTRMHLINIVEMLENNYSGIELLSLEESISFHAKFGFYPDGKWDKGLKNNIMVISKEEDPEFKKYADKAKQILNVENLYDFARDKLANQLLYDYSRAILGVKNETQLRNTFKSPISMKLSKRRILENKDFYNDLFKKYGIDYEIT